MPDNPVLLQLSEHLGPLYSTSANISGEQPIKDLQEAKKVFREHKDKFMIVKSGCISSGVFSTIYDYDNKEIIREGEIPRWKIFN
ncbi:translation factor Sua5 [Mycoplasma ovis str. Michigan]|uniref:Translation factor Sua5 n=2 Tax=Mycoplasma ovis TaxID=171632 RepID=A0ABM5P070_9MOLU|nr:translation factor Sua5 [Mycoplasma ovis str. Michigan]